MYSTVTDKRRQVINTRMSFCPIFVHIARYFPPVLTSNSVQVQRLQKSNININTGSALHAIH